MLSAFLIALREGVEAALVVGIVLVYLNRTGRATLTRWVWGGVFAAVASSLAIAIALERWKVSEDGFEGLLLLVAAVFVVTMIIWMNRVARHLKAEIEKRIEIHASKAEFSAGIGLATFVYLMVVREGAELALILRAVELSSEGVAVWIGTVLGLAVAVAVGLFFFQGTLKISLGKFFSATSTILIIVAVQLALTGIHELSEAMWLPSSRVEMAYVGPIVRNEFFFFTVILGAAALLGLREWIAARAQAVENLPADGAERRRLEWERRKQRRWALASAFTCTAVILILAAEFAYTRVTATTEARSIEAENGAVRIPMSEISDANLHIYSVDASGTSVRFMVIRKPNGSWGTALDACLICGTAGYRQEGSNVICRNCASAIYIPTIGEAGGCNPVGVPSHAENGALVIDVSTLAEARSRVSK
ncbi:MAG TPA: Fe-S-containing protein [Candidatus Saccharimonadales bacterium]|nr:Fe-S-containing protein [Candidatus Saccharimonadales bacterium]